MSELFLAELAARRVRLQELLSLIRTELARELGPQKSAGRHRACRRMPAVRVRNQVALRAASTD